MAKKPRTTEANVSPVSYKNKKLLNLFNKLNHPSFPHNELKIVVLNKKNQVMERENNSLQTKKFFLNKKILSKKDVFQ